MAYEEKNSQTTTHQTHQRDNRISSFSVILIAVCLSLLGVLLIPKLSVKLNPSRRLPQVTVSFSMYGQSARVVEMEVTSKLEAMLSRMKGIQEISSNSANGYGNIHIRLSEYTDPDLARFEISTIIRQTWSSLPAGVSYPSIRISGTTGEANSPFLSYTVNAPFSPVAIQEYVENNIKPKLSVIRGIDRIDVSGASRMVYKLEYDYPQLQYYHVSINDIRSAVYAYLTKEFLGLGRISEEDAGEQWIRIALISGDNDQEFDPALIQVKNNAGNIICLNQLVTSRYEEEETSSYYRINGLNSIYLSVAAEEGANQLTLGKQIKSVLEELQTNLPEGYEFHLSYDAGEYIQAELDKIYFRSGLTIIILLCFVFLVYRNLKYSLLILTSLLINIAIAAIFYFLLKLEMQLFSLAGLTISMTLIIDNAIIMSDQIIQRGNRKVFLAILTATATTVGALSVIFFMDEKVRLNLQDFSWVIIINLTVSVLIALFLVPAMIEKFKITKGRKKRKLEKRGNRRFFNQLRNKRALIYFNKSYEKIIFFMYRQRVWLILLLVLSFGLPVFLLPEKIEMTMQEQADTTKLAVVKRKAAHLYNQSLGSVFYKEKIKPVTDAALGGTMRLFAQKVKNGSYYSGERSETALNVTASLPNGSTKEQMNTLIQKMENYIVQYPEVRQFETNIYNGRQAGIRIYFTKEHQRGSFPYLLKSKLISKSLELGGGSWGVYGVGDGFSNDIKEQAGSSRIKLLGYNYDELNTIARNMRDSLLQHRRIREVTIDSKFSWYKSDYMEFVFDLDQVKLAQMNILPMDLFYSMTPLFNRNVDAGTWIKDGRTEPIRLYSKQANELDIWNMEHYPGLIGNDKLYKLTEVARIEKAQVSQEIAKENQQYLLCLQYEYIGSYFQGYSVMERTIDAFNKIVPLGYKVQSDIMRYWWGNDKDSSHYWMLFLIVVIIFFTTGILFNSLRQAFIIVFIIPISFIGVFLTFYWFDLNFDQGGFAAFILLAGLAVNANIYVLHEYNNIRLSHPGLSPVKVYLKAWNAKIRPVFLTISSTVLGFIPFMIGKYKEAFWFPLAAGTTGGLIISLLAMFVFLPLFMGVGKR
jgi:multidrug efflux pump subunit AcrB